MKCVCTVEIEEYKPGAWEVVTSTGFSLGFIEPKNGGFIALDAGCERVKGEYPDSISAARALLAFIGLSPEGSEG